MRQIICQKLGLSIAWTVLDENVVVADDVVLISPAFGGRRGADVLDLGCAFCSTADGGFVAADGC